MEKPCNRSCRARAQAVWTGSPWVGTLHRSRSLSSSSGRAASGHSSVCWWRERIGVRGSLQPHSHSAGYRSTTPWTCSGGSSARCDPRCPFCPPRRRRTRFGFLAPGRIARRRLVRVARVLTQLRAQLAHQFGQLRDPLRQLDDALSRRRGRRRGWRAAPLSSSTSLPSSTRPPDHTSIGVSIPDP